MGKEKEEITAKAITSGFKTLKEIGLKIREAGPDDPIYQRGWIIGGTSLKKPLVGVQDKKKEESEQKL